MCRMRLRDWAMEEEGEWRVEFVWFLCFYDEGDWWEGFGLYLGIVWINKRKARI